jgi:hypothetical protein
MTLRPLSPALLTHGQPAWRRAALALTLLAANGLVLAHEGHGMEGSHWHATDVLGLLVGLGFAALVWRSRGDK